MPCSPGRLMIVVVTMCREFNPVTPTTLTKLQRLQLLPQLPHLCLQVAILLTWQNGSTPNCTTCIACITCLACITCIACHAKGKPMPKDGREAAIGLGKIWQRGKVIGIFISCRGRQDAQNLLAQTPQAWRTCLQHAVNWLFTTFLLNLPEESQPQTGPVSFSM